MQQKGSLLNGLYQGLRHCLSPNDAMAHASGSQALLAVLDADEAAGPSTNGGTPMHTEAVDHKSTEDEFYGEV